MKHYEILSLLSVIAMAIAFWGSGTFMESEIVSYLQIVAYLLFAASSWFVGVHAAAFAMVMCAITLALKTIRRFPAKVMFAFLVVTLAGGLILNNSGWLGLLPVLAAMGVIYRHAYQFSRMDNAYRYRMHAIDLFLHNILGVFLWGVYAWLIGDIYMIAWRGFMLLINLFNYAQRIWPDISRLLADALPNPDRHKRRKYAGLREWGWGKWII